MTVFAPSGVQSADRNLDIFKFIPANDADTSPSDPSQNGEWGKTIPEWLKKEISEERTTLGLLGVLGKTDEVGDAEVCAYLYTASLTAPMPHNMNEIYIYLTAKVSRSSSAPR